MFYIETYVIKIEIFCIPSNDPDKPRQGSNWDAWVYSCIVVGNLAAKLKKKNLLDICK